MKLTREQSQKLLRECGVWITEACDKCGKLLGAVRWTSRDEPGEWCSAGCRDGIPISKPEATEKRCLECDVPLEGRRSDSDLLQPHPSNAASPEVSDSPKTRK